MSLHETEENSGPVSALFCRCIVYLYHDVTRHFKLTAHPASPSLMVPGVTGQWATGAHAVIGAMHSQPLHPLCNTAEFAGLIRRKPSVVRRMIRRGEILAHGRPALIHVREALKFGLDLEDVRRLLRGLRFREAA